MKGRSLLIFSLLLVAPLVALDDHPDGIDSPQNRIISGPFRKILTLNGSLISPTSEKFLVPRTNSWEVKLETMVPEGSVVTAGDVVVRFDNTSLVSENLDKWDELVLKEEELIQKKNEADESLLNARLRIRETTINREKATIDAGIPAELQELRAYQEAQLALKKADEDVKKAQKELEIQEKNQKAKLDILELEIANLKNLIARNEKMIENMALVASTSGIAVYEEHPWEGRTIQIGDSVQPGWSVMRIPDPQNMQVEIWVAETDLGLIRVGQTSVFYLDAYPERQFTGQVVATSNRGVTKGDFGSAPWFRILMDLDSVDPQIMKPGMSVRAELMVHESDNTLLAPIHLVGVSTDGFTLKPRGQEPRTVDVLGFNHFFVALKPGDGLEEGMELEHLEGQ